MQTAASNCTVAEWLGSSSRQTEGGEGQHELAQRETGALISDGLTGCVDGAVAQEEERRRDGRTSCLKNGAKHRSKTRESSREGGGKNIERSVRGEKSFAAGTGSKQDEADKDTEGGMRTEKPSLTRERSERARAQSGKEEEKEAEEERELTGGRAYGA